MNKRTHCLALIALLIYLLAVPVLAHPGRTDSSGGHYNRSTGEYHYHHGKPEHDHWDMDSDGDLDCPYTFTAEKEPQPTITGNDKTQHNQTLGQPLILPAVAMAALLGIHIFKKRNNK